MFTFSGTLRHQSNFVKPPTFPGKFRLGQQTQGYQKLFGGIFFCILLNIFATAASK